MTLLEVLSVVVIIVILASMLIPAYGSWRARAEEAKCLANLRTLFIAASRCLDASGEWPQIPVELMTKNPQQYAMDWVEALEPYGAPHSSWLCPTIQGKFRMSPENMEKPENYRIDFVGSYFEGNGQSPRMVGRYPWFLEKSASHARGQLVIFADGTTASLSDLASGSLE